MVDADFKLRMRIWRFFSRNYLTKAFTSFTSVQVIGTIISLILLSLYTRYLSPDDYGKIALIMIVVMILSIVVDGGLNTAFSIRFYKLSEKENKKNIFTILIYNFVVVLLVSTVFFLYPAITEKLFMKKITSNQKLLVCLLIFATILGRFYTNFLIITKKPRNYFFVNIFSC